MNSAPVRFRIKFIAAFLIAATPLVLIGVADFPQVLNFGNDDSFFYMKTAFNFARGLGSTFDGVNPTNGYHPLWFLVLAFIDKVAFLFGTPSPEASFRITFATSWLMIVAAFALGASAFRRTPPGASRVALSIAAFLILAFVAIRDAGTEAHITCLVLALYLWAGSGKTKNFRPGIRGALLALLFLCRVDFLFTLLPLLFIHEIKMRPTVRQALLIAAPALCAATAYFAINYLFFGHFLPISGVAKNSFPHLIPGRNLLALVTIGRYQGLRVLFFAGVAIVFFIRKKRNRVQSVDANSFPEAAAGAMLAGFAAFFTLHLLFNTEGIREWYTAGGMFVCAFITAMLVDARPFLRVFTLVCAAAIFAVVFHASRIENFKWTSAYRYAKILEEHTVPSDRILQIDGSGVVGYFSNRSIINGDGLINGFEYREYLKRHDLRSYLRKKNITYYSTYSAVMVWSDGVSSEVYEETAPLNRDNGRVLRFRADQLVVAAPFDYRHPFAPLHGKWMLFRFNADWRIPG